MSYYNNSVSIYEWIIKNDIYFMIGFFIILIIIFYFLSNKKNTEYSGEKPSLFDLIFNSDTTYSKDYTKSKRKGPLESKGELLCKDAVTKFFKRPFKKIRPDFLKNEQTGSNLEIDIYNEDLKLAIEYSGKQHNHYTPYFHKNEQAFFDQQYRDNIKERNCRENGINLIVVPYTIKPQHIELFIYKKVRELGYQV